MGTSSWLVLGESCSQALAAENGIYNSSEVAGACEQLGRGTWAFHAAWLWVVFSMDGVSGGVGV
jgi:hypothetical protein